MFNYYFSFYHDGKHGHGLLSKIWTRPIHKAIKLILDHTNKKSPVQIIFVKRISSGELEDIEKLFAEMKGGAAYTKSS